MTRVETWPALLTQHIEAHRHTPFEWAVHDCGTFLADWVCQAAGWDPLAAVRGRYISALGWSRVRRNDGLRDGADVFDRAFGARIHINQAHRGDGAAIASQNGAVMGIVLGTDIAVPGPHGLLFPPRRLSIAAWSV